jgi:penicillin-binding protein 1C
MHSIFKLQQQLQQDQKPEGLTKILATIDLDIQQRVQDLASQYLQRWQIAGADNVAAVVVDTQSREVLAWVGSSDYFGEHGGAIDYAQVPRSSGSILKPFIYALALANKDISAATLLPDLASVAHGTSNSDDQFLGPMLPRLALANSRNVPAINLLRQVGLDNTYQFLQDLGLHRGLVPASFYGGGLAIGTMPVTLESLIEAYGVLANDGQLRSLRWYRQAARAADEKILDRNIARQISLFLLDPQARLPSFPRMGTTEYNFPVALKTGTSQGYRDAWTLAYSKRYSVGVWVGRSDSKPMRKLGGAASAAQLVQTIMKELHKSRVTTKSLRFAIPEDYESVTLCSYTGKLANSRCHQSISEWVDASQLPPLDDSFESHWVDRRNGLLAGQWTPEQVLEKKQFVNLPAIYQSWGKTKGLVPAPQSYSTLDNPDPSFNGGLGNEMQLRAKALASDAEIGIKILSPRDNLHVMKLPEVPAHLNSLAFNVGINSSVEQVLWYVDGKPYQTETFPYTLRWPLDAGEHRFQAEIPYYGVRSNSVKVVVAE